MADGRFFVPRGPFALGELAAIADARLCGGDPDLPIRDIASLADAARDQITFLDNPRYLDQACDTRAAACLVRPAHADRLPSEVARLITDEPYRGYARIAARFHPAAAAPAAEHPPQASIAAGAHIDASARIGPGCRIASGAVIEADAEIGERCRIDANAVIGAGVRLGADCVVGPGASLSHCLIGARVLIHAGARIGQDGFGFALGAAGRPRAHRRRRRDRRQHHDRSRQQRRHGDRPRLQDRQSGDDRPQCSTWSALHRRRPERYFGEHADRSRQHACGAGRDHGPSHARSVGSPGGAQRGDPGPARR
jgi:UDP-3-O-[3-hydroxymyristoyl] glucosamine N-acyltransferase